MIGFEFKAAFFDSEKVRRHLEIADLKAQSKIGAYIRTRARSSLRRRKSTSSPGSPPSVHSSDGVATLKNIRFGYDFKTKSTVVGPVGLNTVDKLNGRSARGIAPKLHEFGGTRSVLEVQWPDGRWQRFDNRRKFGDYTTWPKRWRKAKYPPRPFMAPAMRAEAKRFPGFFVEAMKAA